MLKHNRLIHNIQSHPFIVPTLFAITAFTLGSILYLPHLNGAFILDDFTNLDSLSQINNAQFSLSQLIQFLSTIQSGPLGRPISLITFAFQAEYWPNNPAAFKTINVLIHLFNGFLTLIIAHYLLKQCAVSEQKKWILAALISAFWIILPIHVSSVLYVIQRMTLLMASFSLLAILGYLYGRNYCRKNIRKGLIISSLSMITGTFFAMFSKENGILVLVYIAVIELTLFSKQPQPKAWKYWLWIMIYCPVFLGILYFFSHMSHYIGGYSGRDFSFSERLLTEPRILIDYLGKILFPRPNSFGLFFDNYPISKTFLSPFSTLLSIIAIAGLLLTALLMRVKQPVLSFAILWFFAGHALESTFIPLELYFEHRNYLPALGLVFALCYYLFILLNQASSKFAEYSFIGVITIYCLGTYAISYQEATLWNNSDLQAITWQQNQPNSKRANILAAKTWFGLSKPQKADQLLQRIYTIGSQDNSANVLRLLINCHSQHLNFDQLTKIKQSVESNRNKTFRTVRRLVNLWNSDKCSALTYQDMHTLLSTLYKNTPQSRLKPHITISLSLYYEANGQYDRAIALLDKAIKQMPKATQLLTRKIHVAIASKQFDMALLSIANARKNVQVTYLNRINFDNQLTVLENKVYTLRQNNNYLSNSE